MRFITLNCWGGRKTPELLDFFARRAPETDVFLLQEVHDGDQAALDRRHPGMKGLRGDLYFNIVAALPDFQGHFARWPDRDRMSTAIFARRSLPVLGFSEHLVYEPERPVEDGSIVYSPRKLHCVKVADAAGGADLIANLHGMWVNGPKTDTPERIGQSRRSIQVLNAHAGRKALFGDFNLLPDTMALRMFEVECRMRNLVLEHGVASTRTREYRHYENPDEPNFADYALLTRDWEVKRFEVLPDVVSDHCPLYVEAV